VRLLAVSMRWMRAVRPRGAPQDLRHGGLDAGVARPVRLVQPANPKHHVRYRVTSTGLDSRLAEHPEPVTAAGSDIPTGNYGGRRGTLMRLASGFEA
jgi:hypothetical protein